MCKKIFIAATGQHCGKTTTSLSLLHLARTVCRRAERAVIKLSHKEKINPAIITYMNRVGDLLFIQARHVNYKKRIDEKIWK